MRAIGLILVALAGCSFVAPSEDALGRRCGPQGCVQSGVDAAADGADRLDTGDATQDGAEPASSAPDPAITTWLGSQRAGYCAAQPGAVVPLCVSAAPRYEARYGDGFLCFDDLRPGRAFLRRTYPRGIALDVGFHWDGARGGHVVTLGSSDHLSWECDSTLPGRRIVIGIDDAGRLWASGPETGVLRDGSPLTAGTHLVSYRVTTSGHALFVDGRRVGHGEGTSGVTVEFPERWAPGFVLGDHNQRWWKCDPSRSLRMAGFFVHLRDDAGDVLRFDAASALEPGEATVLLFEPAGAELARWYPSAGVAQETWTTEEERDRYAGWVHGARWTDDVWADCLTPP